MDSRRASLGLILFILSALPPRGAAGQTNPSPPASASAYAVQLEALVREAMARNPEIQAAQRVVQAKRAHIPQAGAWPDPMLSVSYGGNLVPPFTLMRGDPSSQRQVMAQQEIPYPGKTRLRTQIASREADAETLAYEGVWRRVAAEVKQAYFDLSFVDQSLETLHKDRALLEKFAKITEIRYSVGKASQQDILKAQIELSRLIERETLLTQQRRTLVAQLNSLRDLLPDTPLGSPAKVEASPLPYSLDELTSAAATNFPALKRQRVMVESNQLGVKLAEKDRKPDFAVSYGYMQRDRLLDMYTFTFTTSLPIFHRRKQDMAIAEAAASLAASRHMEENDLTVLRYRVKQEYLAVQTADELRKLYSQGIMPQSTLALESSLSSYETGQVDFLTVITNFATVLDYELTYYQQLAEREKALARLEELTALSLIG